MPPKLLLTKPLAQIFKEEGMGLDVVSGGEMSIARLRQVFP